MFQAPQQNAPEIERVRRVRAYPDRSIAAGHGLFKTAQIAQRRGAAQQRLSVVWSDRQGLVIARHGLLKPPHIPQNKAAVEPGDGHALVHRQGGIVAQQRLIELAESLEDISEIRQRLLVAGADLQGVRDGLDGLEEAPLLGAKNAQHMVRIEVGRICRQYVLVERCGFFQVSLLVQRSGAGKCGLDVYRLLRSHGFDLKSAAKLYILGAWPGPSPCGGPDRNENRPQNVR